MAQYVIAGSTRRNIMGETEYLTCVNNSVVERGACTATNRSCDNDNGTRAWCSEGTLSDLGLRAPAATTSTQAVAEVVIPESIEEESFWGTGSAAWDSVVGQAVSSGVSKVAGGGVVTPAGPATEQSMLPWILGGVGILALGGLFAAMYFWRKNEG